MHGLLASASSGAWWVGGVEVMGVGGQSVACWGPPTKSHRLPMEAEEDQGMLEACDAVEASQC